jgi:hypothetical protein
MDAAAFDQATGGVAKRACYDGLTRRIMTAAEKEEAISWR